MNIGKKSLFRFRSDKKLRKKQRTLTRLVLIMTSLVVICLLVTSFFVREYIKKREDEVIRQKYIRLLS